jgi:hypothetical protein
MRARLRVAVRERGMILTFIGGSPHRVWLDEMRHCCKGTRHCALAELLLWSPFTLERKSWLNRY